MTHQLKTRREAKKAIQSAIDFKVFQQTDVQDIRLTKKPFYWAVFEIGGSYDDEVDEHLHALGISLIGFEPQRNDSGAPKRYDDLDAAIDALISGYWLCKVPDAMGSPYYRLMVVDKIKPRQPWD